MLLTAEPSLQPRLFFVFVFVLFVYLFVFKTGFLCVALAVLEPSVDQAGLKLRNPPDSATQVLGIKVCATTAQQRQMLFLLILCLLSTSFTQCTQ